MDSRDKLQRMMRREFGHLLNSARIRVVTVSSVDIVNFKATINMAQGDPLTDPQPDPQDVGFLDSYTPKANDLAYMLLGEGAPILIGAKELEDWHDFSLPSGYSTVASTQVPGYRLDNQGRVWWRGACNVAASNAAGTKFNAPTGYRPQANTVVAVPISNGTGITQQMRYNVNTDGTIVTGTASPAATQLFIFEGVSYDTRP